MDEQPFADQPATENVDDLGLLVIPLLKGVMHRSSEENRWLALLRLQGQIRDYVRVLGLELFIDEAEGYAFLRTPSSADDESTDDSLPRLVSRRRLTFSVSLLLALLRKRLAEFDTQGGDSKLVMTHSAIADLVAVFQPSSTNEAKLADRVEADINKVVELGFLHPIGARTKRGEEPSYEVRRILKAFVDAQWLSDFDARLAEYRSTTLAGSAAVADSQGSADDD